MYKYRYVLIKQYSIIMQNITAKSQAAAFDRKNLKFSVEGGKYSCAEKFSPPAVGKLLTLKRRCKLNREIIWLSLSSVSGVPFQPRNRNAFSLYSLFYYIYRFASRRSKNGDGDNLGYCSHESVFFLDILSRTREEDLHLNFGGWKIIVFAIMVDIFGKGAYVL